jgi:ribose-phosphate pyrophosphokinase
MAKINKYPDGTSYVSDTKVGKQVFKVNSYEDLWHLNQFVDAFWSEHNIRPNIIIPNLIDAQADRRFNKGESSGLKLVLKFLNGIDANFTIFHPHNAEVVEAMMDNVSIMDNHAFVKNVLNGLIKSSGTFNIEEDLILMSADAGGFKPLMKLCDQLDWQGETFSASKARTKDGMKQHIGREDFGGKDILIIDDISVYGGTFKGLAKALRGRNVGKLYLAVSHMTMQNLGEDPVTNYFDKVFTTNSKFDEYYREHSNPEANELSYIPENLEIIKMF